MTNTPINLIKLQNFEDFYSTCINFGIEINNNQLDLFKKYYEVLIEWNKKINLISRGSLQQSPTINDPILEKHFLDSIVFLPEIKEFLLTSSFDIGSGAGFPAIPLVIMKSDLEVTLCESTRKKTDFLNNLVSELNLGKKVKIINDRVENINKKNEYKNKFNFVTARAVAKLDELVKYALPLLKENGCLLAYKARNIDDEIKTIEKIMTKHNLQLKIFSKEINDVIRQLVIIQRG